MAKRTALKLSDAPDLIGAFNLVYTPQDWLIKAGYAQKGNSFRHPNSETGNFSGCVKTDANGLLRVNSLSLSDPLYTGKAGGAHDAFSTFCTLFHGGDRNAALKDAGDNLLAIGVASWNKAKRIEFAKQQLQKQPEQQQQAHAKQGEQPPRSETNTKTKAIAALLGNVTKTNLWDACISLGWKAGTDGKQPKQKHFKIAITYTLIKTAKKHNWHIVHDTGFFHIYNGAFWMELTDAEVKKLLEDAAVKMGYDKLNVWMLSLSTSCLNRQLVKAFLTNEWTPGNQLST